MKTIDGFGGKYSVTETGQIYSHRRKDACNRTKWGMFLQPNKTRLGYLVASLFDNNTHKIRFIRIHRLVAEYFLGLKDGEIVDHIDGNRLNNNVSNLRICTPSQNQGNRKLSKNSTSGFKGVCWQKNLKKWQMACRIGGKRVYAWFDDKEDAARAYDKVASEAHGAFAKLNFP